MPKGYTTPRRDVLDMMHARAKRGLSLREMIQEFPDFAASDIEYWMRQNLYIRNKKEKA